MDAMADESRMRTGQAFAAATWGSRDGHRGVTYLAALGAVAAIALAAFGIPAVDLHPPLHHVGIMDPLCGGTRAARYAAQGQVAQAWTYNPLGIVTVYGAGVALLRAALGAWWPVAQRHGELDSPTTSAGVVGGAPACRRARGAPAVAR